MYICDCVKLNDNNVDVDEFKRLWKEKNNFFGLVEPAIREKKWKLVRLYNYCLMALDW
jgi:hypothetical protein